MMVYLTFTENKLNKIQLKGISDVIAWNPDLSAVYVWFKIGFSYISTDLKMSSD